MRTSVAARHERILTLLRQRGQVRVVDLASEFEISPVTARRDVDILERQGALHRRHGVAYMLDGGVARVRRPAGDLAPLVGMVVPSGSYYYAEVVRGARSAVADAGGRLVVGVSNYDPDDERNHIRQLRVRGAQALILTPSWPTGTAPASDAAPAAGLRLPTVLVERRGVVGSLVDALDRVGSAHDYGGYLAVRHLASLGRWRIAFLGRESPTAAPLRSGFHAALRQLGLPLAAYVGTTSPVDVERVLDQACRGEVDALLIHTDADAVHVAQLARRRGLRVPTDLSIVAYDDETAALAEAPLTAVAPPKFAVGHAAARLALGRVAERRRAGPGAPLAPGHHVDLLPELRIRESCGALAARG